MLQTLPCFVAKFISTHAARDNPFVTQKVRHVREIRRRAAELLAPREHVPKQLAQSNGGELFHGRLVFPERRRHTDAESFMGQGIRVRASYFCLAPVVLPPS